uniref:Uncharacterized protein n=1 Tax=Cacopsylla melanoneura TaxID=428564 RepID=A0A8D8R8T3_9HEMI
MIDCRRSDARPSSPTTRRSRSTCDPATYSIRNEYSEPFTSDSHGPEGRKREPTPASRSNLRQPTFETTGAVITWKIGTKKAKLLVISDKTVTRIFICFDSHHFEVHYIPISATDHTTT